MYIAPELLPLSVPAVEEQLAEAWLKMTPEQRQGIAIKKMWVSPCKEWMCQQ